jgi:Alternative oxidase
MIFLELRHPGQLFRAAVLATQWVFTAGFSLSYLFSPTLCHRYRTHIRSGQYSDTGSLCTFIACKKGSCKFFLLKIPILSTGIVFTPKYTIRQKYLVPRPFRYYLLPLIFYNRYQEKRKQGASLELLEYKFYIRTMRICVYKNDLSKF